MKNSQRSPHPSNIISTKDLCSNNGPHEAEVHKWSSVALQTCFKTCYISSFSPHFNFSEGEFLEEKNLRNSLQSRNLWHKNAWSSYYGHMQIVNQLPGNVLRASLFFSKANSPPWDVLAGVKGSDAGMGNVRKCLEGLSLQQSSNPHQLSVSLASHMYPTWPPYTQKTTICWTFS